jgi:hypothetical protein
MKNEKKPSENNTEDLQFENELLKLKIRAEFGSSPTSIKDLPPDIEYFFLKNILNVERAFANHETISLFDKIGQPIVLKSDQLDDTAIEGAAIALEDLLNKKGIFVTFPKNETCRKKYVFITEKLFNVQVDNLGMPEIMMHFNCTDVSDDMEDL